ncbi:MAG: preprotein translocase subunit SecY [Candidatus Doudnabacteria bacterium]|nr:preprotein translocase subunit SecY [Candidatus Doudnabacteria bacterium]
MNKLALIWKTKDLRNKILIVTGLLLITRVLAHIPISGIDITGLKSYLQQSQFFNLLDIFSGGGLTNFSIAMLGVGPYITATIIMQLLTIVIPSWAELQKEGGEAGRQQLNQYTRWMTIVLAPLQGFGTIRLLQSQGGAAVLGSFSPFVWFTVLLSITTGTMLLMWLGEIMSEFDVGNGVSLIIFAGIVARLPANLGFLQGWYDPSKLPTVLAFAAMILIVIAGVVLVTEAQRNIPIAYAKRVRGNQLFGGVDTHLPLRLNQAGVIPIIFAISVMLFPAMLAQFFVNAKSGLLAGLATKTIALFQSQGLFYGVTYFILVMAFTYFYTAVVFNPEEIAENVQKNGGFVPGLRPGAQTADFLSMVLNRITLAGAFFLAVIAILPLILQNYTGTTSLTFGGTSLLIVVSVVIEVIKKIEAQLTMHDYEGF